MELRQPIRYVAKRTGMSPHLIRMWEKRYSVVEPHRTDTGRRLYSDEDIEKLILLRRATQEGHAISQVAHLSVNQLRELISSANEILDQQTERTEDSEVLQHLNSCLQAMEDFDATGLETRLLRASVSLGQNVFLHDLLHPLLEKTGEMWSKGQFQVAHEHLASAVVRSLLGSMYLPDSNNSTHPLLISTTPIGQLHEFGALMVSVTAANNGWRTLYLGPNMPAENIAEIASSRKAAAIALSIVYPAEDPRLQIEFRKLRQMAGKVMPILVGGRSIGSYKNIISEVGAIAIGDLDDLRSTLLRLK